MIEIMPGYSRRSRTTKLILHHTAALSDLTVGEIDAMHRGHGWKGIGYCLYIRKAGDLHIGRGEDAIGAHAGSKSGMNSQSCGICLSGNFEIERPTDAQLDTLHVLLARLIRKYKLQVTDIIGHRDVTPTACPGRNMPMSQIRLDVARLLSSPPPPSTGLTSEQVDNLMESVRGLYQHWDRVPESWRVLVRQLRAHPLLPPQ